MFTHPAGHPCSRAGLGGVSASPFLPCFMDEGAGLLPHQLAAGGGGSLMGHFPFSAVGLSIGLHCLTLECSLVGACPGGRYQEPRILGGGEGIVGGSWHHRQFCEGRSWKRMFPPGPRGGSGFTHSRALIALLSFNTCSSPEKLSPLLPLEPQQLWPARPRGPAVTGDWTCWPLH